MDETEKFAQVNNKKELIRIYEMKLKEAQSDEEKDKLNKAIAETKEKLSNIEKA